MSKCHPSTIFYISIILTEQRLLIKKSYKGKLLFMAQLNFAWIQHLYQFSAVYKLVEPMRKIETHCGVNILPPFGSLISCSCLVFEDNCRLEHVIWSQSTCMMCDEDGIRCNQHVCPSDSEHINRNYWSLSEPSGSATTAMSIIMSSSLWKKTLNTTSCSHSDWKSPFPVCLKLIKFRHH